MINFFQNLKVYLLLFAFVLSSTFTFAQCGLVEVSIEQRTSESPFIVEGRVTNKQPFWNQQQTLIHTSYTVEIYKVFKGSISSNEIEIITEGGELGDKLHKVFPNLTVEIGDVGTFFCKPSEILNSPSNVPYQYKFVATALSQGYLRYDETRATASDPFKSYSDINNSIYRKISSLTLNSFRTVKSYNLDQVASSYQNSPDRATPSISSFSPTTITAGTNSTLTINGSNFGSSANQVLFRNSDDGGGSWYIASGTDIVSWSSTQIQVKVIPDAGTGTFGVKNSTNQTGYSSSSLTVSYNITNVSGTPPEPYLINQNGSGGYTYKYSTNTANSGVSFDGHTNAKTRFESALQSWKCNTGWNITVSGTTTINSTGDDGTNVVMFDNSASALASGVLGTGYSFYTKCGGGTKWRVNGIDIKFKRDGTGGVTWYFGASTSGQGGSQTDFESVALHELGHNHQLGHVINSGKVMHYTITTGTNSRILEAASDIAGGNWVMAIAPNYSECSTTGMTAYNCSAPPVADFSGTPTSTCNSTLTVNFTDLSTGTPTSWSWTFTGGSPSSSTVKNPTGIYYASPGTYTVSLTSTNAYGSDGETKTDYIQVGGGSFPITENFQSGTFPPSGWTRNNADAGITWEQRTNTTGAGGVNSTVAWINHWNYSTASVFDEIVSPKVSLSGATGPQLTFYVSYGYYNTTSNYEQLRVLLSTDCGSTFPNVIYNKSSDVLATVGQQSNEWFPTSSSHWRKETLDLSSYIGNTITFKFESTNGYGNNLFIDSISVSEVPPLSASISGTNVTCNGGTNGSADLTVSGGSSPYTYAWSNSSTTEDISSLSATTYTVTVTDASSTTKTTNVVITQPTAISISLSGTNPICFNGINGSATASVSGGVPGYTYIWSTAPAQTAGTATGLSAGTYTVTVTDANSCTKTNNVTLTQPTAITATMSSSNPFCNGGTNGTASVIAGGGTPGYTYLWTTSQTTSSINTLPAGTYTVTITDSKSCTKSNSVTLTQPAVLTASMSSTNPSCNGGSNGTASVTANGGTPGYLYNWSNSQTTSSITSLVAGTYTVTITDSYSCTATGNVTLTQPTPLSASMSSTNPSCYGYTDGSATVSVSGGTPGYTYLWNNSQTTSTASGLSAGNYTVTVTDAKGCTITNSVSLTQPSSFTATMSSTNPTCSGGNNGTASVSAAGGTPGYSYLWSNSNSTTSITNLTSGTYSVTVTDSKSCSISNSVIISDTTTWTGATSTDWNTTTNWDNGFVPDSCNIVKIPGAPANKPIISNSKKCKELIIMTTESAYITITGTGNLEVTKQ